MRTLLKFAVLPAVLAAAALAASLAPRAGAAAPPSAIDGTYAGKMAFKFSPMTELGAPARGSDTAEMTINVMGPDILVNMTVHADAGDQLYTLNGTYGLGRFHASGGGPGGQTTIVGKATGSEGRVKLTGSGFTLSPDSISEIKFALKETEAPK